MERKVTCPNCQRQMTVKIWSETLAQVLRCSGCGHKFTYDPAKDKPGEPEEPGVTGLIEKGIKKGISTAAYPVQTAMRGINKIMDSVDTLTTPLRSPPKTLKKPSSQGTPEQASMSAPKVRITKKVTCPYCSREFQAGLPDNDKLILTTKCPDCHKIFTFLRGTITEEKESVPEEKTEKPFFDEDFAVPVMQRFEKETGIEGKEARLEEPTELHDKEEWETLETTMEAEKGIKGKMVTVSCPFCNGTFDTPAPDKKGKVRCPICERDFQINSRGEYIARKVRGGLGAYLAKVCGKDMIKTGQEAVKEALEGVNLLREPGKLRPKLRTFSGMAGLLLVIVAFLGLIYAGALAYHIPDMSDDDPSGLVSVSGEVLFANDTLQGADVNLTYMGLSCKTNSEGFFYFEYIPAGDHTLKVSATGKGTYVVKFTIGARDIKQKNKDIIVVLPEKGTVTKDLREESTESPVLMTSLLTIFVILVSMIAFMAGLLALQGKRFRFSLYLSGLAILTFGFLLGSVLALVAMILIILGRKDFIS